MVMVMSHAGLSGLTGGGAHPIPGPRLLRVEGGVVMRVRSRALVAQPAAPPRRRLRACQLVEDRQGAVPGPARPGRVALVGQDHADAVERPSFPGAQAAPTERPKAPLQAAGRLLQAALAATHLAQVAQDLRLPAAPAELRNPARLSSSRVMASPNRPCRRSIPPRLDRLCSSPCRLPVSRNATRLCSRRELASSNRYRAT
jgi:hypothetical protein